MMRFGAMMAGGVVGVLILKLLMALLFPMLGAAAAMLMMGLKVLFWLAIGYVVYRLFFKRKEKTAEV